MALQRVLISFVNTFYVTYLAVFGLQYEWFFFLMQATLYPQIADRANTELALKVCLKAVGEI